MCAALRRLYLQHCRVQWQTLLGRAGAVTLVDCMCGQLATRPTSTFAVETLHLSLVSECTVLPEEHPHRTQCRATTVHSLRLQSSDKSCPYEHSPIERTPAVLAVVQPTAKTVNSDLQQSVPKPFGSIVCAVPVSRLVSYGLATMAQRGYRTLPRSTTALHCGYGRSSCSATAGRIYVLHQL